MLFRTYMTLENPDVMKALNLPLGVDAVRVLLHLVVAGATRGPVKISYPAIGRACFQHEVPSLGDEARKKRAERAVKTLEDARYLQIIQSTLKTQGAANEYRVFLSADAPERQVTERKFKAERAAVTPITYVDIFGHLKERRVLPESLRHLVKKVE